MPTQGSVLTRAGYGTTKTHNCTSAYTGSNGNYEVAVGYTGGNFYAAYWLFQPIPNAAKIISARIRFYRSAFYTSGTGFDVRLGAWTNDYWASSFTLTGTLTTATEKPVIRTNESMSGASQWKTIELDAAAINILKNGGYKTFAFGMERNGTSTSSVISSWRTNTDPNGGNPYIEYELRLATVGFMTGGGVQRCEARIGTGGGFQLVQYHQMAGGGVHPVAY